MNLSVPIRFSQGLVSRRPVNVFAFGKLLVLTFTIIGVARVSSAATTTNQGPPVTKSPVVPKLAPPALPHGKPPVEFFRELLSMSASRREELLAGRPAESRKLILAKLQEYEALTPEQRELRLHVTELRYYLLPLMSVPPAGRQTFMERVPDGFRSLIDERLRRWDQLSPEKQKELLENETWLRQVADFSSATPSQQRQALTNMPAAQRESLEVAIGKWRGLDAERRDEMAQRFEEFFGLRPQERARTLLGFSEAERHRMQRTLQSFDKLNPARRAQCVRALDKLAQLTPEQRAEFLKNAERWQALSPAERKAWRDLVFTLSLPPSPRAPLPPLPPRPNAAKPGPSMATNQ